MQPPPPGPAQIKNTLPVSCVQTIHNVQGLMFA